MSTFRKVEIVDARKFEGGIENGSELVFWVNSKEGKAFYYSNHSQDKTNVERIRVAEDAYSMMFAVAYPGDWIMQRQDGHFEVVRQQELDAEYEQV